MFKTAGIIAEYNPFHLGHRYQMEETRKRTGADFILVVMSGNFVQRGEPAIFEKSQRARMALLCGADLVIELPVSYAAGSAEDFACGAVSLLSGLNCVDYLSFGSEEGDLEPLKEAASMLSEESPRFSSILQEKLRQGLSFPRARSLALEESGLSPRSLSAASSSNNLLGIEYLKALERFSSSVQPVTIQRKGSGYHDNSMPEDDASYASASAIRRTAAALCKHPAEKETGSLGTSILSEKALSQIPEPLHDMYRSSSLLPVFPDDCSALLHYKLLSCLLEETALSAFSDFSPELAQRLKKNALKACSFSERAAYLKTRQYTYTRASRGLIHLLLNIRTQDMQKLRQDSFPSYARILGFKKSAAPLLKQIKEKTSIPVISRAAKAPEQLSGDLLRLWNQEIYASHIYHAILQQKYGKSPQNEYSRPIVIL